MVGGEVLARVDDPVDDDGPPEDPPDDPDDDDPVVIGSPDGLSTHQRPYTSFTPCPFACPGAVSPEKVYRGHPL